MNRSGRQSRYAFSGSASAGTMRLFLYRPSPMTRFPRLTAFAVTLLLAASSAQAEQKFFGLSGQQVSNVGACSGEATLGIAAFMMYSNKKPYADTLASALKANETADPKLPVADIERRLKAVYDAKPPSSASWAQQNFERCVIAKKIPVIAARVRTCYVTSFYMSLMVDLRKRGGDSKERIVQDLTTNVPDAKQKEGLVALIGYYYDQPPSADPNAQAILDIRHFLTCASADQRPVSGTK
jgi:hypothetical protein